MGSGVWCNCVWWDPWRGGREQQGGREGAWAMAAKNDPIEDEILTPVYGLKNVLFVFSVQNPVPQNTVDGLNQTILYQTLPYDLLSETCIYVFP